MLPAVKTGNISFRMKTRNNHSAVLTPTRVMPSFMLLVVAVAVSVVHAGQITVESGGAITIMSGSGGGENMTSLRMEIDSLRTQLEEVRSFIGMLPPSSPPLFPPPTAPPPPPTPPPPTPACTTYTSTRYSAGKASKCGECPHSTQVPASTCCGWGAGAATECTIPSGYYKASGSTMCYCHGSTRDGGCPGNWAESRSNGNTAGVEFSYVLCPDGASP